MKNITILLTLLLYTNAFSHIYSTDGSLIKYVNPLIGTSKSNTKSVGLFGRGSENHGQTLPAVIVPNGMNCWTPETRSSENKCVAPYYYEDNTFRGFRNSHWIVGGCTQDYGSMTITPQFGKLRTNDGQKGGIFHHFNEISQPNYYAVYLDDQPIKAELTGKSRSAIMRFTFLAKGRCYILVTSNSDEQVGSVMIDSKNNIIKGENPIHRIYQGQGESAGYSSYFMVQFQKQPISAGTFSQGAWFEYEVQKGEVITVKTASSFCDYDGASQNLNSEIPHWDFNKTLTETTAVWNQHLSSIKLTTPLNEEKEIFYTALYHTSFLPRVISDVDGRRPFFNQGKSPTPHIIKGNHDYYTDFSMWDTFRALHPLLNILSPEKNGWMMQSLVEMYEEGGWLPIFPCWNSYTNAMIGDHCISAIVDAYIKGVRNFDTSKAYEAMCKNAFESPKRIEDYLDGKGRRALKAYKKLGYIPLEETIGESFHKNEQVSRTMEYAYDDYCLSQMALFLQREKDFNQLIKRSRNYQKVINPHTGYVQGRHKKGKFTTPPNLSERVSYITEGTPWHYTWFAPHDPYGLMAALGGREQYVTRLDSMFSEGRYWHGNEPCHHVAYMYNYAGEPWKTQIEVRKLLDNEYNNSPGGLSGNEDAGQMSAWYVFSSLGFYPVCPGTHYYMIGTPLFAKAEIRLPNNKSLTIIANHVSRRNCYIQSMKYNGMAYSKNYITHYMIMHGGTFVYEMGDKPNKEWGTKPVDCQPNL